MNSISLLAQSSPYYSQDLSSADSAAAAAAVLSFMVFMFFAVTVIYVVTALLLGRIFKKAGVETWKAWVPIYNNWIMFELGGQKGYWAVLAIVPFVNIVSAVFMYIAMYYIGLGFKKDGAFVLLAIFLPLVWYIWLAFDDSTWNGPRQLATQPHDAQKNNPGTPTNPSKK